MAGGKLTDICTSESGCVADGVGWPVIVGVLLPLATGEEGPSVLRPSVRRGVGAEMGPEGTGEISMSSASPLYLGMPSAPISTLGGLRK